VFLVVSFLSIRSASCIEVILNIIILEMYQELKVRLTRRYSYKISQASKHPKFKFPKPKKSITKHKKNPNKNIPSLKMSKLPGLGDHIFQFKKINSVH
jgi:hypothetical protein